MRTKKLFLMLVTLIMSICTFAQSNNSMKGDVNGDNRVDVADIVAIIEIMKNGGGTEAEGQRYFYLGTTQPTASNYQTLPGVIKTFTSIDDAIETTVTAANGETLYMLCPIKWMEGKTVGLENQTGETIKFLEAINTSTISDYAIYRTKVLDDKMTLTLKTIVEDIQNYDNIIVTGTNSDIYISKAKLQLILNIPEDISVFQAGIYCSKNENPNNDNGQTIVATNVNKETKECLLQVENLEMNTLYYYKSYIYIPTTSTYYFGETRSFYTENIQEVTSGEAIDLGLSVKWCSHNLGALKPEEFGEGYAWGELNPYSGSYAYISNGNYIDIGNNICGTEYDVAKYKLGGSWQLPNYYQLLELFEKCAYAKALYKGVPGYIVEGTNRNSIFIPYGITNIYSGYHESPSGYSRHYYGNFSGFMTGQLSNFSGSKGRVLSFLFDYNHDIDYLWYYKAILSREKPQAVRPICLE